MKPPRASQLGIIKFWWLIIILVAIAWYYHQAQLPVLPVGITVQEVPIISKLPPPQATWWVGTSRIIPLATITIKGRVLHTEPYWFDDVADISPVDIAIGWQGISDSDVISQMSIGQGDRSYYFNLEKVPYTRQYVLEHSRNLHIIPANDDLRQIVKTIKKNHIIQIKGLLVKVVKDDGVEWTSYTEIFTRTPYNCFVIWLENLEIENESN